MLTGKTIENEADVIEVMKMLHEIGARTVVISSSLLGASKKALIAYGSIGKFKYIVLCSLNCALQIF